MVIYSYAQLFEQAAGAACSCAGSGLVLQCLVLSSVVQSDLEFLADAEELRVWPDDSFVQVIYLAPAGTCA